MQRKVTKQLYWAVATALLLGVLVAQPALAQRVPTPLASSTSSSSSGSSSAGCPIPPAAVMLFYNSFEFYESNNYKTYLKQCSALRKTCQQIVRSAERCSEHGFESILRSWTRKCLDISDRGSRTECMNSFNGLEGNWEDFLGEMTSIAGEQCQYLYEMCTETN